MASSNATHPRRSKQSKHSRRVSAFVTGAGFALAAAGVAILFATFYPILKLEREYEFGQETVQEQPLEIPDPDFSIIVPKIRAAAKVVRNVDPYNSSVYQRALTQGVAHAKGTAFPGEGRNIFLFSHSSVNFFEASRYNSIFYLLHKLEIGDEIIVYYEGEPHTYQVTSKKTVAPDAVEYLQAGKTEKLTLMTCWPPGTTFKRLLIQAEPIS